MVTCLHYRFVYFYSFYSWNNVKNLWIPIYTQINYFFSLFQCDLSIVSLSFKSRLVNKLNQPLNCRKYIIYVQTLKLERLKAKRAFHIFESIANMFGNFNFLSDLHLIIVINLYLKVRRSNTPCDTSDYFIKSF